MFKFCSIIISIVVKPIFFSVNMHTSVLSLYCISWRKHLAVRPHTQTFHSNNWKFNGHFLKITFCYQVLETDSLKKSLVTVRGFYIYIYILIFIVQCIACGKKVKNHIYQASDHYQLFSCNSDSTKVKMLLLCKPQIKTECNFLTYIQWKIVKRQDI